MFKLMRYYKFRRKIGPYLIDPPTNHVVWINISSMINMEDCILSVYDASTFEYLKSITAEEFEDYYSVGEYEAQIWFIKLYDKLQEKDGLSRYQKMKFKEDTALMLTLESANKMRLAEQEVLERRAVM